MELVLSDLLNSDVTMTSREISEVTGKRHNHITRDIKKWCQSLSIDINNIERKYIDSMNREQSEYILSGKLLEIMKHSYMGSNITFGLQERAALNAIEQVLGVSLIRQYKVGKYRVDGYDAENNVAYEIDEHQYNTPSHKKKDAKRQSFIESVIGCRFVRIDV